MKSLFAGIALLALTPMIADTPLCGTAYANGRCCKTCKKGKACGNSCIASHLECHQPKGCACNG